MSRSIWILDTLIYTAVILGDVVLSFSLIPTQEALRTEMPTGDGAIRNRSPRWRDREGGKTATPSQALSPQNVLWTSFQDQRFSHCLQTCHGTRTFQSWSSHADTAHLGCPPPALLHREATYKRAEAIKTYYPEPHHTGLLA